MSNLVEHAKREFLALGYKPIEEEEDGPNKWIQENVLELLHIFSKQGHSGTSAPYCVGMFKKLALFEPLGPLTGEDHEWSEVISDGVFQNNRCSHIFKQADRFNGQAYDIRGRVFREPNGCCYTNGDSHVPVTFPYVPTTEYVDVVGEPESGPGEQGGAMRRGTQIPDGDRAVFRVGSEEVTVLTKDGELRVYADNVLHIIPWATNTIRIRIEPIE